MRKRQKMDAYVFFIKTNESGKAAQPDTDDVQA